MDYSRSEFRTSFHAEGKAPPTVPHSQTGLFGTRSSLTNGQVLTVTDGLSNITQTMGYGTSGSALGQVTSVSESDVSVTTSAAYAYNAAGERLYSAITTPNGTFRTSFQLPG